LAATITAQLLHPLVLFNIPGADPRRLPRFELDVPEPEDLQLYAEALPKLAGAGMRIGLKDLHRRLRIPMADEGEELLRGPSAAIEAAPGQAGQAAKPPAPTAAPTPTPAPGAKPPDKSAALAGQLPGDAGPRDALDDVVDEALGEWQEVLAPMVQPLLAEMDKAVAAGETLEAFAARLPGLIERMDGRPLAERLARASFMGRLAGEADLDLSEEEER
jgi:phage gp29-like protein